MTELIEQRTRPWMAGPMGATLRTVSDTAAVLGECPLWWPERAIQFWVDIRDRSIWALDLGKETLTQWRMPELTGGICLTSDNRLLVALESQLALFDPDRSRLDAVWTVRRWQPGMRFNEVRCDPWGCVWAGYMNDRTRARQGWLFRLTHGGLVEVLGGVAVPNSLAWSRERQLMYFTDGSDRTIWQYDIDPATGALSNRRIFAERPQGSVPDGATVDSEGFLWSASYGAGTVVRYAPDGAIDTVLDVPVSQPTSCEFGGQDLDLLFITSAAQRLTDQQLAVQPLAGHTFVVRVPVPGLPTPRVDLAGIPPLTTAEV
jgi:sugar lactone lactonase YvrE